MQACVCLCISIWYLSVPACGVCSCVCLGLLAGLRFPAGGLCVCVILFGVCLWLVVDLGVINVCVCVSR